MKFVIGIVVIAAGIFFGASSFVQTTVEYADFQTALSTNRKVQVKGEWQQGKESRYDAGSEQFSFFMKDEKGCELKVVYDGMKPNNFELVNALVIKGRAEGSRFHASEILTKCPSKYEADPAKLKKNLY